MDTTTRSERELPSQHFADKTGVPGAHWIWDPDRPTRPIIVDAAGRRIVGARETIEAPETPATRSRHHLAGDWILDAPAEQLSRWGEGQRVLWPQGEALFLVGGIGTGKTTVSQQLILHGIGALEGPFLGLPVDLPGVVGYVAADRPAQIRRSFGRMVEPEMRDLVNDRMDVWSGALPFALDAARTGQLADFAQERGWDVLVLDSLKDLVSGTTDDEAGLRINQQIQECTARGIEVLVLHHQRKASGENRRPKQLDDVYGSRWLTAGAGSVVMLWADAGSELVEMSHLKQPAEMVGPLTLRHDHQAGRTTVDGEALVLAKPVRGKGAVLNALPGTNAEIQARTGQGRTTVSQYLAALERDGVVRKVSGRGNEAPVWHVTEQVSM